MASGIKCDPGIPDVWRFYKKDSVKTPKKPEWESPIVIEGDQLVNFNKRDSDDEEYKEIHDKLPWCNYLIFKIHNKKEIRVEKVGELEKITGAENCATMLVKEVLPEDEPRYVTYKYDFTLADGRSQNKIVGFLWCPDTVKVGPKMIYAASKDEIGKKLEGMKKMKQASDHGDVRDYLKDIEKEG